MITEFEIDDEEILKRFEKETILRVDFDHVGKCAGMTVVYSQRKQLVYGWWMQRRER